MVLKLLAGPEHSCPHAAISALCLIYMRVRALLPLLFVIFLFCFVMTFKSFLTSVFLMESNETRNPETNHMIIKTSIYNVSRSIRKIVMFSYISI